MRDTHFPMSVFPEGMDRGPDPRITVTREITIAPPPERENDPAAWGKVIAEVGQMVRNEVERLRRL